MCSKNLIGGAQGTVDQPLKQPNRPAYVIQVTHRLFGLCFEIFSISLMGIKHRSHYATVVEGETTFN